MGEFPCTQDMAVTITPLAARDAEQTHWNATQAFSAIQNERCRARIEAGGRDDRTFQSSDRPRS